MSKDKNRLEKILNQPGYWVEGVNGFLYEAILNYMEENNLNRTKLAEHLGISKGRVSQILNEGDINFSIEKVIEIALKVDVFPDFRFTKKSKYFAQKEMEGSTTTISLPFNSINESSASDDEGSSGTKIVSIISGAEGQIAL